MPYTAIRERLADFYFHTLPKMAEATRERVYRKMDAYVEMHPDDTSYALKAELYRTIAEEITPVLFEGLPFYFETGALSAFSDGKFNRGGHHANGWLYERNMHLFI